MRAHEPASKPRGGRFRGVVVPMVTPLDDRCRLDEPAATRIVDHLLSGGAHGVFVLGTTGEMPSLPDGLRRRLVELTVRRVAGRASVYAGVSDNCLRRSVRLAGEYFRLGVSAVVAHLPCAYALDAREQSEYFRRLLDDAPGPVVLYNMPALTGMSIPIEVVADLCGHERAAGLKDSENDPRRLRAVLRGLAGRKDFAVLTGVTAFSARAVLAGADGIVPSTGNLAPRLCRRLFDAAARGRRGEALARQRELDRLGRIYQRGLSLAGSLAALKAAMSAAGLCAPTVAPPLRRLGKREQEEIAERLSRLRVRQPGWRVS